MVRPNLSAFDSVTGSARSWNPDPDANVLALAASPSGVVAGGSFTTLSGRTIFSGRFARFEPAVDPPAAPTGAAASAGDGTATVSFVPGANDGGAPVGTFTAIASPGGHTDSGSSSPITVTGLANGTSYTFTVTATNAAGTSSASSSSNAVTPLGVPGAPTGVVAGPGNAAAVIRFNPPASDGGTPITSYRVTATPGGHSATGADSPIVVDGLSNGTSYTFTVTATNAIGTGAPSSPTSPVAPFDARPLAPDPPAGPSRAAVPDFVAPTGPRTPPPH